MKNIKEIIEEEGIILCSKKELEELKKYDESNKEEVREIINE